MFPGIKLISTELVLIPFWLVQDFVFYFYSIFFSLFYSFKMPDVTERLRQDSVGRTRASNLVFTIWAVFGGFILHFLLSNYLTVLLRPSYEEPVETAADLIKRDITPFYNPGGDILRQFFAASSDPNYQEISQRLVIPKDWDEHFDMYDKVATTGLVALVAPALDPWYVPEEEFKNWYRSSEAIGGFNPYGGHLTNKNFPLKKVKKKLVQRNTCHFEHFIFRSMILIF